MYSGISFPPRRAGKAGFFAIATDLDLIKQSIFVLLSTRKGEMPGIPEFGSSIHDLLFENINSITQGLITQEIKKDIETWEPRVTILSIKAFSKENTRYFDIQMRIKATGEETSFVTEYS
jgi:phage baseplate assembly protein W